MAQLPNTLVVQIQQLVRCVCVCVRTSQGATVRTVRTLFFSDNVHIQYAYFIPEGNVRSLLDVLDKVSTEH